MPFVPEDCNPLIDLSQAISLGRFQRPADFQYEDELLPNTPRPLPRSFRKAGYFGRLRQSRLFCRRLGLCLLALSLAPFTTYLGWYFVPLEWTAVAGVLLLLVWLCQKFTSLFRWGHARYLRTGETFVGRVLGAKFVPPNEHQWHLDAAIEFAHPVTGEMMCRRFRSANGVAAASPLELETSLVPGTYVTMVGMSPFADRDLDVYAFLDLSPDRHTIRHNGRPVPQLRSSWRTVFGLIAGLWGFAGLIWAFMVGEGYFPIGGDYDGTVIALSLGLAAAVSWLFWLKTFTLQGWQGHIAAAGSGPLALFFITVALNCAFDFSEGHWRPVHVSKCTITTYQLLARGYSISVRDLETQKVSKVVVSLPVFSRMQHARVGLIRVKDGAFGFRWPRDCCPALLIPVSVETPPGDDVVAVQDQQGHDARIRIVAELDSGQRLPIPTTLRDYVRDHAAHLLQHDAFAAEIAPALLEAKEEL